MQHNIRKMAIGAVLLFVVIGVAYWVQQYFKGTKASSVPMAQFALANGAKISPGQPFELILQINPNLKTFYSFDLSFTYDHTKVSPQDAANVSNMVIPLSDDVKILTNNTKVDAVNHTVQVMGIRENGKNDPFMGNTPIDLVKVLFNMNASSALPVSFKWNDTSRTSLPETIEKKNLEYTGLEPTTAPKFISYACGSDDFSGTTLNTANWTLWTNNKGTVGVANGVATLYLPVATTASGTYVTSVKEVAGDFTAEIILKSHSVTVDKKVSNFGMQFIHNNGTTQEAIQILRQSNSTLLFATINNGETKWNNQTKDMGLTANTPIKIKIERNGSTAKMYYDLLDNQGYKLLRQYDNFYTGNGNIQIFLDNWTPDFPQASGIVDDYKLTCYKPDVSVGPVDVPTATPKPGVTTGPSPTKGPTPTPVIGGAGAEGTTTTIVERADTLYVNSLVAYPAPFRYEQEIKLERGDYRLTVGAIVHVKRGSGLVLVLQCNEAVCGTYKKNDVIFKTPTFPQKSTFSEYQQSISIPDGPADKSLVFRLYCEDGSECDIDYISLEDAWGSELLRNPQFAEVQPMNNPRKQPAFWEVDATANMYGSIDPAVGNRGALMINNSAK